MRLFGREITLSISQKAPVAPMGVNDLRGYGSGWRVLEPFAGAWQCNVEWTRDTVLAFHAVFACITLIAADIGKLRPKLQMLTSDGIWVDTASPAFSPVLRKPNSYQNHIQFKERWIISKLVHGNAYALKERDSRGVVVRLYMLDPQRVLPLVTETGDIYYQLGRDTLAGVASNAPVFPASEIIHDRMNCLFHDLVGLSPIFACGLSAAQGLEIQKNQAGFFKNASMPGGIIIAPERISDENAREIKAAWADNFSGPKAGSIAVLGDGLKFEPMRMNAVDSQLIEQLEMTARTVCSTFHVPAFMVGVGDEPAFANGETRTQHYYSQCLQSLIESWELCMDEGLGIDTPKAQDGSAPIQYGTALDLKALLRMDRGTQITALGTGVDKAIMTPNEARKEIDLPPLDGGDTVYMQQQEYSLAALAKRDAQADPFASKTPPAPPTPPGDKPPALPAPMADDSAEKFMQKMMSLIDAEMA